MHEIVAIRVRYGFRRVLVMLHRQGVQIGKTAAYRLYREEQLMLRSKRPKRRRMVVQRHRRYVPQAVNQAWSLDFVGDQLTNGQKIRALTIVDVFTREAVPPCRSTSTWRRCRGDSKPGYTRASGA